MSYPDLAVLLFFDLIALERDEMTVLGELLFLLQLGADPSTTRL